MPSRQSQTYNSCKWTGLDEATTKKYLISKSKPIHRPTPNCTSPTLGRTAIQDQIALSLWTQKAHIQGCELGPFTTGWEQLIRVQHKFSLTSRLKWIALHEFSEMTIASNWRHSWFPSLLLVPKILSPTEGLNAFRWYHTTTGLVLIIVPKMSQLGRAPE